MTSSVARGRGPTSNATARCARSVLRVCPMARVSRASRLLKLRHWAGRSSASGQPAWTPTVRSRPARAASPRAPTVSSFRKRTAISSRTRSGSAWAPSATATGTPFPTARAFRPTRASPTPTATACSARPTSRPGSRPSTRKHPSAIRTPTAHVLPRTSPRGSPITTRDADPERLSCFICQKEELSSAVMGGRPARESERCL